MPRIDDKILLRKYHEEGDLHAREKLIEQYMSLVRSLARRTIAGPRSASSRRPTPSSSSSAAPPPAGTS